MQIGWPLCTSKGEESKGPAFLCSSATLFFESKHSVFFFLQAQSGAYPCFSGMLVRKKKRGLCRCPPVYIRKGKVMGLPRSTRVGSNGPELFLGTWSKFIAVLRSAGEEKPCESFAPVCKGQRKRAEKRVFFPRYREEIFTMRKKFPFLRSSSCTSFLVECVVRG